jgi:hypothetical protein
MTNITKVLMITIDIKTGIYRVLNKGDTSKKTFQTVIILNYKVNLSMSNEVKLYAYKKG